MYLRRNIRQICYTFLCAILLVLGGCGSSPSTSAVTINTLNGQAGSVVVKKAAAPIEKTIDDRTRPLSLQVPSVNINAPIEQVQALPDGDLATPTQSPWINAGWYSDGPLPGQRGSAVIDGHLDRPGGYPAVFWNLRYVHIGAPVYITDSDGKRLRFHVTRIAYYTPQDAPLQDIFGNRAGTYLNLITCAGDWIPSQRQTTLRLVVYTTLG